MIIAPATHGASARVRGCQSGHCSPPRTHHIRSHVLFIEHVLDLVPRYYCDASSRTSKGWRERIFCVLCDWGSRQSWGARKAAGALVINGEQVALFNGAPMDRLGGMSTLSWFRRRKLSPLTPPQRSCIDALHLGRSNSEMINTN